MTQSEPLHTPSISHGPNITRNFPSTHDLPTTLYMICTLFIRNTAQMLKFYDIFQSHPICSNLALQSLFSIQHHHLALIGIAFQISSTHLNKHHTIPLGPLSSHLHAAGQVITTLSPHLEM